MKHHLLQAFCVIVLSGLLVSSFAKNSRSAAAEKQQNSPESYEESTKWAFIDKNFYQDKNISSLRKQVDKHLNVVKNLCTQKLKDRARLFSASVSGIKKALAPYENEYLSAQDASWLNSLNYNLDLENLTDGQPILLALKNSNEDLRLFFQLSYSRYYKLENAADVQNYPDEWAKKFSKGLDCLYAN